MTEDWRTVVCPHGCQNVMSCTVCTTAGQELMDEQLKRGLTLATAIAVVEGIDLTDEEREVLEVGIMAGIAAAGEVYMERGMLNPRAT